MIIKKIKLRDLTAEQWDRNRVSLCNLDMRESCDNCIFKGINCSESIFRSSWINNKEKYNDNFLDQEIELEFEDENILTKEEKDYLNAVIKYIKNSVISITKYLSLYDSFEFISIRLKNMENFTLPRFKENTMYKNMKLGVSYSLKELGL